MFVFPGCVCVCDLFCWFRACWCAGCVRVFVCVVFAGLNLRVVRCVVSLFVWLVFLCAVFLIMCPLVLFLCVWLVVFVVVGLLFVCVVV